MAACWMSEFQGCGGISIELGGGGVKIAVNSTHYLGIHPVYTVLH